MLICALTFLSQFWVFDFLLCRIHEIIWNYAKGFYSNPYIIQIQVVLVFSTLLCLIHYIFLHIFIQNRKYLACVKCIYMIVIIVRGCVVTMLLKTCSMFCFEFLGRLVALSMVFTYQLNGCIVIILNSFIITLKDWHKKLIKRWVISDTS